MLFKIGKPLPVLNSSIKRFKLKCSKDLSYCNSLSDRHAPLLLPNCWRLDKSRRLGDLAIRQR